jgi:hypothetical protein
MRTPFHSVCHPLPTATCQGSGQQPLPYGAGHASIPSCPNTRCEPNEASKADEADEADKADKADEASKADGENGRRRLRH